MINVEVEKNPNENTLGLLRRFSRKVQNAGIIPKVKSSRYKDRPFSKLMRKKRALKRIEKRVRHEELVKLGKAPEKTVRFKRFR